MFNPGDRVRLRTMPTRTGTVLPDTSPLQYAGMVWVQLDDDNARHRVERYPVSILELVQGDVKCS